MDKHDEILKRLDTLEGKSKNEEKKGFFVYIEKLLLPFILACLTYFVGSGANKISQAQLMLANAQEKRQQAEAKTTLQLKYLDLFYKDINDPQKPQSQLTALSVLYVIDPEIGGKLATAVALNEANSENIRQAADSLGMKINTFGLLLNYKVIFYCLEGNEISNDLANTYKKYLNDLDFKRVEIQKKPDSFFVNVGRQNGFEITGYATGFNRRHRRSGYLFQNRYKSILCQEDTYLKELVRYIHLNPLRARLVGDITALDDYSYSGHGSIMGKHESEWQTTDSVLKLFGGNLSQARHNYHEYVAAGTKLGKQTGLTGGGLIRSAGGWSGVQQLRKAGSFQKSDERILGDGDFVESVLAEADEKMTRRFAYKAKGISLEHLQQSVTTLIGIDPEELVGASKVRKVTRGRAIFCYLAVREMGISMTDIAKRLKIALPTVSGAVQKGEKIVKSESLNIVNLLNVNI